MTPEPSGWPPAGEKIVLADQRPIKLHVRTRRSDLTLDTTQKAVFIIGRDPNADISFDDTRVSWSTEAPGGRRIWVYEDPRSTNGTFLGTERVHRVEITSLRVLMLGDVQDGQVLRLSRGRPAAARAPAGTAAAGLSAAWVPAAPRLPAAPAVSASQGGSVQGGYQPTPPGGGMPSAGYQPELSQPSVLFQPTGRYQVQKAIKIGRLPTNDVVVDDLGVSRVHAELRPVAGGRPRARRPGQP